MGKLIIDETTNTLVGYKPSVCYERLNYLVIPHTYNGKQIDAIGPRCFGKNVVIGLLCVEEGVKRLEARAFEEALILDVRLPKGLTIGERCFANSELRNIFLPRDLHTIKQQTFLGCKSLESIHAERGINTIGDSAFSGCENLQDAHFGIIKTIRNFAFAGCTNLQQLELGSSLQKMERCLFSNCHSLESLKLQGSFDELHPDAFKGATSLRSLTLSTTADSLYFPPHGFDDTILEELTLLGNFEPDGEQSSFPENITFKAHEFTKQQLRLGYYFPFEPL